MFYFKCLLGQVLCKYAAFSVRVISETINIIVSCSRLTSGIVSPSELPDSPTQTVPSSPRSSKGKLGFPHSSKQLRDNKQRLPQKSSVFEDNTTKFKEENTPIQFSTATSLSSLTIDDHEDPGNGSSSTKV